MYVEEPWKSSVPEVHHKITTDGSDLRVIDPNGQITVSPISKLGIYDAAYAPHQLTTKLVINSSSTIPPGKIIMFAETINDFLG